MRSNNLKTGQKCGAALIMASYFAVAINLMADPFIYAPRDALLGFRRVNGTKELLVNLGPSSNFFNATPGSSVPITGYSPAQLVNAFTANFNDLRWSVSAAVTDADGGDPSIPSTTLWMTRRRTNNLVQSVPWNRNSVFSQGGAANKVSSMGLDGQNISNSNPPDPVENTPTAVTKPGGGTSSYSFYVGSAGNFGGNFAGNVENNTGASFQNAVRSDLYELPPGSGPGRFLGYFELRTDGTMIFQAASTTPPTSPPAPTIQSLTRDGTVSTVSFTTTNDAAVIYRLRATNSAGFFTSVTNWPPGSTTVTGNGQVRTLQDESTEPDRVYSVTATR